MADKTIKALENNKPNFYFKIFLIIFLVISGLVFSEIIYKNRAKNFLDSKTIVDTKKIEQEGKNLLNSGTKQIENSVNDVLGEATSLLVDTATKSAENVSNYIFDSTIGNILKQIEKLPIGQQEKIKERICQ